MSPLITISGGPDRRVPHVARTPCTFVRILWTVTGTGGTGDLPAAHTPPAPTTSPAAALHTPLAACSLPACLLVATSATLLHLTLSTRVFHVGGDKLSGDHSFCLAFPLHTYAGVPRLVYNPFWQAYLLCPRFMPPASYTLPRHAP